MIEKPEDLKEMKELLAKMIAEGKKEIEIGGVKVSME